ncbi:hypothetical protein GCM10010232_44210 [Streptomyces amakusaensis]
MTITEERKKNVDFSVPHFDATQALLTAKKSGLTSLDQARSREARLGVQSETTGESYTKARGFDPVAFESADAVLNGLRTGQVDGVVLDHPVVQGWLKDSRNVFLDGGVVVEQGPAARVVGDPRHERTRDFLDRVLNPAAAARPPEGGGPDG